MGEALDPGNGGGAPAPTGGLDIRTDPAAPVSPLSGPTPTPQPAPSPDPKPTPSPAPKPGPAPRDSAPRATTIADVAPADPDATKPTAPADWPEDWRARLAGDNKKAIDKLARYKSPQDVLNAYMALETKLGDYAKKLPTHYTEQELADYRKSNGIPDKPDEYNVDVPGIVWGEQDKPMLDSWKQFAHENHLPPDLVKIGPAWYAREQEAIVARLEQQDMQNFQTGSAALQAEWGAEFKGNINAAKNLLEAHPGMWETIMGSRAPDGMKLGDSPSVLKAFAALAKEANPFATIAPRGGDADPIKTIDTRISEIHGMMRDRTGPYWKGPESAKIQAEYRDLVDMKERAAAGGRRAA